MDGGEGAGKSGVVRQVPKRMQAFSEELQVV